MSEPQEPRTVHEPVRPRVEALRSMKHQIRDLEAGTREFVELKREINQLQYELEEDLGMPISRARRKRVV